MPHQKPAGRSTNESDVLVALIEAKEFARAERALYISKVLRILAWLLGGAIAGVGLASQIIKSLP